MYNSLFGQYWAISATFLPNLQTMIQRAITSGPIEDAQRVGLPIKKSNGVAIVSTRGPMVKSAGWLTFFGFAGTRETQAALQFADADKEVESIQWLIDTPGGSVDGLEELAQVARKVKKPLNVFVDGMMASAGYYVGSQADSIIAAPRSLVGSIGTRMMLVDASKYYNDMGIKMIPIDTGEFKSAGAFGTEISDVQIAEFQRIVDGYNEYFLNAVAKGRNMSKSDVKNIADGRVFFAEEAIALGLVDSVSTFDTILSNISKQKSESSRRIRQAKFALLNLK